MDRDSRGIVLDFHEHWPKDKLHEELLSLRDPWVLADYVMDYFDEQGGHEKPCVFEDLDKRMLWPKSDRWLLWIAGKGPHESVKSWEQCTALWEDFMESVREHRN